ncbi:MAG: hypothetical protein P1U63_03880 [Coxiellaceae bacterium]|nr:hypothetical protein [Coxiellaceae bacterium]
MFRKISFEQCLEHMKRCSWQLDDIFKEGEPLDFSKSFIPQALTAHDQLRNLLSEKAILLLNHITAKSYLNFFYFVEEFIIQEAESLEFVSEAASAEKLALKNFASEERKHQALFKRVMRSIDAGLVASPKVIDFEKDAAKDLLALSPMGVLLLTLHLEVITQEHYIQAVKDNLAIDHLFEHVLQCHWIEESQHANIDYLELSKLVPTLSQSEKVVGINDYISSLDKLLSAFKIQSELDAENLSALCDQSLSESQLLAIKHAQERGYCTIFILNGLHHKQVSNVFESFLPDLMYVLANNQTRFDS